MLVRPRQIQRAPSRAVDFSGSANQAIVIPAQRIGITTAKGFSVMAWVWPTVQFPNGTQFWSLENSVSATAGIFTEFNSFSLFAGTEVNTASLNPPVINGWNLYAFTWTPGGVVNYWAMTRNAKNFATVTGATTALVVGATTNLYIGNNNAENDGYPCRLGGFSVYNRTLSQQEVFAHLRQRAPVSSDQLLIYLPFRDLSTVGFDEVSGQSWPTVGTFTAVSGPGIGVPEVNPAVPFVPSGGGAFTPKDPIFFGTNA